MAQLATDDNAGGWTDKAIAKQLTNLYYAAGDPGSYGGVERLYQRAKEIGIPVTRDGVARYLTKELPTPFMNRCCTRLLVTIRMLDILISSGKRTWQICKA